MEADFEDSDRLSAQSSGAPLCLTAFAAKARRPD